MSHKFLQNETLSMGFTAALSSSSHFLVSTMGSKTFWRNIFWFLTGLQYRDIFPSFISYSRDPVTNFKSTNLKFSRFFLEFCCLFWSSKSKTCFILKPSQNKKGQKNSICTIFDSFFSAATSCKKRNQKWCS